MSWLMAALYDRGLRSTEEACLHAWRAEVLGGLTGEVLEVGAGTGLNLPHYPDAVERLVLSEPDRHMRAKLVEKLRGNGEGGGCRIEISDTSLESLPMEDASFDAVVGTLMLCSVRDLDAALAEAFRVLRPGGRLAFLEHVAAEDRPGRLRWQRRIEPVWKRISGNCHLTRRTEDAIRAAGFDIEWIRRESMRKSIPVVRPTIRGVARKPRPGQEPTRE
jgi:ubiquinone/menaquinone biosynthesis C-methylase UbiE